MSVQSPLYYKEIKLYQQYLREGYSRGNYFLISVLNYSLFIYAVALIIARLVMFTYIQDNHQAIISPSIIY